MQEEDKKKELNGIEKLKEIGLKNVSNKTFINLENLTYLLDKDFEKLHKTKALGFIQILEREFGVDLNTLKKEYLYFQKYGKKRDHKAVDEQIRASINKGSQKRAKRRKPNTKESINRAEHKDSSFKIGPYLLLLLAGVLGYFLFNSATGDDKSIKIAKLNNSVTTDLNENIANKQESLFEDSLPSNSSNSSIDNDDIDLNEIVQQMLKEDDLNKSNDSLAVSNPQNKQNNDIIKEQNSILSKEESSLKEKDSSKKDSNENEDISRLSTTLAEIENSDKDEQTNTQNNNNDNINRDINNSNHISTKTQKVETKSNKDESKKVAKKSLYITPIQKAWVGVIYLDDYSKKDFLIRGKLKLNPNRDQLIVVGHNKFKIFNKGKEKLFGSKKSVRFIYQGGDLEEISKQEFIDRSAGVHW